MPDLLRVTFADLEAAAADVNAAGSNLEAVLAQNDTWVAQTAAAWQGNASQNYQTAQAEWTQSAQELRTLMAQISTTLQQTAENYAATEAANAALWG